MFSLQTVSVSIWMYSKTMRMKAYVPATERAVRLSEKESLIIDLLARKGELHAYEIVQLLHGAVSFDAIYTYLNRLQKKGVIECRHETTLINGRRLPRRFVKLMSGIRRQHEDPRPEPALGSESKGMLGAVLP